MTGDRIYTPETLTGRDGSGTYVPVGYVLGSRPRGLEVYDDMMALSPSWEHDAGRIVPPHEPGARTRFPTREDAAARRRSDSAASAALPRARGRRVVRSVVV